MAYTPTTWATGDTITASAMNKIENGIANAGGALICNMSYDSGNNAYILDKTVQEIYDALYTGTPAYVRFSYGGTFCVDYNVHFYLAPIIRLGSYDGTNVIRIMASRPANIFVSSSPAKTAIATPSVLIFSASGLNQYPTLYANVSTNSASMFIDESTI